MNNMEKKIGSFVFKKYEDFWLSNILFNNNENTFEIYQENLNETAINKILLELNKRVVKIDIDAISLLKMLSKVFWGHNRNNDFIFSGFIIDEATINLFADFRMCYHCSGVDNFSDYANWYIDIKDFRIIGCNRQQL
jgi:hypothetical protein